MPNQTIDPAVLLETARAAAHAAAAVHRTYRGRVDVREWGEKGTFDFVSHVDREAEARIVSVIRDRYPAHAILAEEGTAAGPLTDPSANDDAEWLWVVDPLDGTTNYLHRYPMHAASIAVLHRGKATAGVVLDTASGTEWTAVRGGGAFRDGEPIDVSTIEELRHALIGTGFPFRYPERLAGYLPQLEAAVRGASGVRRAGSAALDLCHVASGWLDGFWELVLSPWDVAAGTLIVREAGGVVTTLDGGDDVLGGGSVLAGNRSVHAALGALLRGASRHDETMNPR